MTIAVEEKRLRSLFERVEVVEDVARTLPEDDERRARLLAVSDSALAEEGTIRPVIAARLLGLSEKTVRAWAAEGVLAVARRSPRLLLDVRSVHAVSHLVSELRAAGQDRDLLDQVWRRLEDAALLDRDDLRESLGPDAPRRGPRAPPDQLRQPSGEPLKSGSVPTEVIATPRADQQIAGLDRTHARAFGEFLDDLATRGYQALGYRLSGPAPVDHMCVKHLRDSLRVVVAFEGQ
jgi:hypothetical protein